MITVLARCFIEHFLTALIFLSYFSQWYLLSPSRLSSVMNKSKASDRVALFLMSREIRMKLSVRSEV